MKKLAALLLLVPLAFPLFADDDEPEKELRKTMTENLGGDPAFRRVGPFLLGGPLDEDAMDRMEGTVTRCSGMLKKQYFDKDPEGLLAVYLLPTGDSYNAFCLKYLGEKSGTPYGFYLPGRRALVMNIGTGSGTLVHEMTHALMEPDFPKCPCWFSEGFASLFEQSSTSTGKIRGLENWRLPLLQRAIGDGSVPTWEKLCGYVGRDFYGDGSGLRYAAARYLCFYLQEKGLLEAYYEKFRDGVADDAGGYKTLVALLDKPVEEVEKEWREWVKGLKFE
ncbi:MAG: hypothetical protein HYY18_09915 [Planctomycetes bacterium]|nr:hypothetical protein [Planctomycetota bacterium]